MLNIVIVQDFYVIFPTVSLLFFISTGDCMNYFRDLILLENMFFIENDEE
jgi:hypothetical protein